MLAEWHVTPDYIVEHWTEELLFLMVDKMTERKQRETEHAGGSGASATSEAAFFVRAGIKHIRGGKG